MKKTLAILLALLAAASVTLAACTDDNGRTPVNNNNDVVDNGDDDTNDTEDDDSNNDDSDTKDTDSNTNNNNDTSSFETVTGTKYAAWNLRLRSQTNTSSDSLVLAEIPAGAKLQLLSTNGTWTKVSYTGETTQEGYVMSKYLAGSSYEYTFTKLEGENVLTLTFNKEKTGNILFYETPSYIENADGTHDRTNVYKDAFKTTSVTDGYTLKLTAHDKTNGWGRVEFVGKVQIGSNAYEFNADNPGVFYVVSKIFTDGRITGADSIFTSGGSVGGSDLVG